MMLSRCNRTLCTWLLLCAVLLRAAIPQGFMPGSMANGTPLVVCFGGIYKTVLIDAQGKIVTEESEHQAQSVCPFAAAPLATPVSTAIAWRPDFLPDLPNTQRLASGVLPSHSPHIHLPRGPPALS